MAKSKKSVVRKKVTGKKAVTKKVVVKKVAVKKKAAKKKISKKLSQKAVKKVESRKVVSTKPVAKVTDYSKVLTPLGERILVRLTQKEMITAGGIIIPDSADVKSAYLKAVVLAVGTGAKTKKGHLKPLDVKVGDTILFQRHVSVKIEFNAEELYILNESNVLGIA